MCKKCMKMMGLVVFIVGFLFLLVDVGVWSFWGLQWWTIVFLLGGLWAIFGSCCGDCCDKKKK